jgi:1-acyl-sn-glycerol-3-phosphate acyltransferase
MMSTATNRPRTVVAGRRVTDKDVDIAGKLPERDMDFIRRAQPVLEAYASYFAPEVRGFDNVPTDRPVLVVGNHSGGATPPDMPILFTRWWRERGVDDPLYGLFHSFFINLPGVGKYVRRAGAIEAGPAAAEHVLRGGGNLVVYPGGDHEAFRPWGERNTIDFAGRTGFIKLALRTGVPIVPAVSCGAHETSIILTRGEKLVRFMPHLRPMRVKVSPIVLGPPFGISLGMPTFPLPAKVTVQLAKPIDFSDRFGPEDADDPRVLAECYRAVTTSMQATLDQLAAEGTSGLLAR